MNRAPETPQSAAPSISGAGVSVPAGSSYRGWIYVIGFGVLVVGGLLALRAFVIEPFSIPSSSMLPTLVPRDVIVVDKGVFRIKHEPPQRGDVVAFRVPKQTQTIYVSRVVGMPGERFAYRGDTVYIDDVAVEHRNVEPYELAGQSGSVHEEHLGDAVYRVLEQAGMGSRPDVELVIPAGEYLMLGDNRDNARDSRYIGTIPQDLLVGRVLRVWWNGAVSGREGAQVR